MDFFDNRYFRLTKVFACIIGQWPYQSKGQRIIISTLFCIVNLSLVTAMVSGLLTQCDNLDDSLNVLTVVLVSIIVATKLFNCIFHAGKLRTLLDQLKSNWCLMSDSEVTILKKSAENGRLLIVAYAVFISFALLIYIIASYTPQILNTIKPLNESRPRKRVYKSYYFVDEDKYFYYLLLHEQLAISCSIITVICVDTLYVKYVEHACGLFSVLRYRLENIIKDTNDNLNVSRRDFSKDDEEITKEVSLCITLHRSTIEYADTIESVFATSIFLQIGINMILLSTTGYVTLLRLDSLDEFLQFFPYAVGQISHVFYNTLPGQRLIDSSEEIGNSVYCSQWYRMPLKAQKLLISLMFRSSRPCSIQAFGGTFILSMETFSTCIKKSFSYFTVLLSMQN